MLFPLPLTAFEQYMLADDRPDQPMCFYLRLNFWGGLTRPAFEASLKLALVRHPLFQAFVREVDGKQCWVLAKDPQSIMAWDEADPRHEPGSYIDLVKELGVRVYVTHTDDQARVLFQFHHACTDGIGAVRFIEDLLSIYTAEHDDNDQPPRLVPVNLASLRDRGRHGLGFMGRLMRLPIDSLASLGIAQFFLNRPTAIETPAGPRTRNYRNTQPSFVSRRICEEQLKALRAAAKSQGVTVNDLLVRDLMLAIDAWNTRHNPMARGGCTRISVPVNLRRAADAMLPSTNVVSMVFVDRRVKETTNPRRLLMSIRRDTFFIKTFRLALVFTWIVELLHAVKGGFAWMLGTEGCLSTAVLSNLGVQFDDLPLGYLGDRVIVGDALLDSIDFLPPIRRGTNASLGVVTYAGELMVSLQFDPSVLSSLVADDLLRLYDEQLASTAGLYRSATQQISPPAVAESAV